MPIPNVNQHPEDVKASVRKTGVTLSSLARDNGFSDSAGRKALYQPIPRVNRLIAKHLGKKLHEIWPEWFDEAGNRITNNPKDSRSRRRMPSQKGRGGVNIAGGGADTPKGEKRP